MTSSKVKPKGRQVAHVPKRGLKPSKVRKPLPRNKKMTYEGTIQ